MDEEARESARGKECGVHQFHVAAFEEEYLMAVERGLGLNGAACVRGKVSLWLRI